MRVLRALGAASLAMLAAVPVVAATLTVTNLNDSGAGSLRAQIAAAGAGDTIVFASGLTGTIPLATTLAIAQTVTIQGPGASIITVSGQNTVQDIVVTAGTLSLSGLTIANGRTAGLGGGISLGGAGVALNVSSAVFQANQGGNGGAIAVGTGLSAMVDMTTFSANTATAVGGGAFINSGTLRLTNSTLLNNTAPVNGGAINTQPGATTTLINTTFNGNVSTGLGGATSSLGTIIIEDSTFSNNHGSGGSVLATGNTNVTLYNNVFSSNQDTINPIGAYTSSNNVFYNPPALTGPNDATGYGTTNPIIATSDPLMALGSNGGPTQTMLPVANGAADCTGAPAFLPPGIGTDQRGFPRTTTRNGSVCLDAGAVQLGDPLQAPTLSLAMLAALGALLVLLGARSRGSARRP